MRISSMRASVYPQPSRITCDSGVRASYLLWQELLLELQVVSYGTLPCTNQRAICTGKMSLVNIIPIGYPVPSKSSNHAPRTHKHTLGSSGRTSAVSCQSVRRCDDAYASPQMLRYGRYRRSHPGWGGVDSKTPSDQLPNHDSRSSTLYGMTNELESMAAHNISIVRETAPRSS